ncbi:pyridoxal kinase [Corynebacterium sp. NML180780]|uniref:pyridoxal kinase n=1 Tax=Corynebacterium sp. NML180780 TaxID=2598459 RepID=UPI001193E287|nr:pyridoxal kinase [Corynebacterium sp. NML180780]TVX79772.1 pyridoxal kinase [Corynebacterium sp. NML180780]
MNIVSLQSAVAYGHVGNSAAVFPMQRLGHEVWPVHTVNFSNHTEYPTWRGPVLGADNVREILRGMEFAFPQVDLFVSGYLGTAEMAEVVRDAVVAIKEANPQARYVCDPVIGNSEVGSFVNEDIPDVYTETLIPLADAITPNQWELSLLTGRRLDQAGSTSEAAYAADAEYAEYTEALADAARSLCSNALITSVETGNPETIGMVDVASTSVLRTDAPRLGGNIVGAGDLATALYAALIDVAPQQRLDHLAGTMGAMVRAVRERGLDELPLVELQECIVDPARTA